MLLDVWATITNVHAHNLSKKSYCIIISLSIMLYFLIAKKSVNEAIRNTTNLEKMSFIINKDMWSVGKFILQ